MAYTFLMDERRFQQLLEFLEGQALFGGFSDADMAQFMPLLQEDFFPKGTTIVTQGEMGNRLYFIEEGNVEVLHVRADAREILLVQLGKGDAFGEMELIDIQARSASVRALDNVKCLSLSNRDIYQIYNTDLELYSRLLLNIAREISRRLRKMDDQAVAWLNTRRPRS
ncbi:MAG: cyclic nucleotide-binding domain-containing protein [Opitutaceae bacterium]